MSLGPPDDNSIIARAYARTEARLRRFFLVAPFLRPPRKPIMYLGGLRVSHHRQIRGSGNHVRAATMTRFEAARKYRRK